MTIKPFAGVRACVFDAYGTLLDVASAARRCAGALGDRAEPLTNLWREKQLQYTWLLTLQGRHADFVKVTADALDFALESLSIRDPGLRARLLDLYMNLDCFAEAPEALHRLKGAGLRLAVLSNGAPAMLEAALAHNSLRGLFDAVLSVEEVGVYKPHPKVYQLALDRLALPAEAIVFVSSNGWDAWAAAAFGMRVAWCNRTGRPRERLPGAPDCEIQSLAGLPELISPA
jgi:2-haloacid dehalogenase